MSLGDVLRKLRIENKLSQIELAEKIGVCQSTYFYWENDRAYPNSKHCHNLASALGVELKDIISGNLPTLHPVVDKLESNAPITDPLLALNEELIASLKQLIVLQQRRINDLERENELLLLPRENDSN